MASNRPLPGDLTVTGQDQASLNAWQGNVTDLTNELQSDHATNIAVIAALKTAVNAIITAAAATGAAIGDIGAVTSVTASPAASLSNSTALTLLRS